MLYGFGLQGGMADAMLGKGVFDPFRNLRPVVEVVDDHMGSEGSLSGADGPHVDVIMEMMVVVVFLILMMFHGDDELWVYKNTKKKPQPEDCDLR